IDTGARRAVLGEHHARASAACGSQAGALVTEKEAKNSTALRMLVQSGDSGQRFCVARTTVQSINPAKRACPAKRRGALVGEHFAVTPDEQRHVLAGRNASVSRQRMQLVEVDMLRITAESLFEIGHERLGLG